MTDTPDTTRRTGIHFVPDIRLDNVVSILVMLGMLITASMAWSNVVATLTQQAKDIARVEKATEIAMPRTETKQIEAVLIDKIADARSRIDQTNIRTESIARDINASLLRIEEKLDRKADKPGGGR